MLYAYEIDSYTGKCMMEAHTLTFFTQWTPRKGVLIFSKVVN